MTPTPAPFEVKVFRLEGNRRRLADSRLYLEIETDGAIAPSLRIEMFEVFETADNVPAGIPVPTRDLQFDQRYRIEGPAPLVFARLNHASRQRLVRLGASDSVSLLVRRGHLLFDAPLSYFSSERSVDEISSELRDLAQHLAKPGDRLADELYENARSEPLPRVRERIYELLWLELEDERAIRASLEDPSGSVRLQLGSRLGAFGFEHLKSGLLDLSASDVPTFELATRSAQELIDRFEPSRVEPVMRALLESTSVTAFAAVLALARCRHSLAFEWASQSDPSAWPDSFAEPFAIAFASTAAREAEPILCAMLDRSPALGVRVEAAQALGRAGGPEGAAKLRPLSAWLAAPSPLRKAAKIALERIESRRADRSGSLSITDPDRGALSAPQSLDGALSPREPD